MFLVKLMKPSQFLTIFKSHCAKIYSNCRIMQISGISPEAGVFEVCGFACELVHKLLGRRVRKFISTTAVTPTFLRGLLRRIREDEALRNNKGLIEASCGLLRPRLYMQDHHPGLKIIGISNTARQSSLLFRGKRMDEGCPSDARSIRGFPRA